MNLTIKIKLKLNKLFIFKKIKSKTALTQDDIVVAIGIIKNPTSLKKTTLISTFSKTEVKEMQKGIFVLCRAKKKVEKTLIKENAGNPIAK